MLEMKPGEIIKELGMQPHPEGGHYVETFRDTAVSKGRSTGTAIYFLLQAGEVSDWHKVDATEIWHYHAGAPLKLAIAQEGEMPTELILGADLLGGQRPQGVVPANFWQSAQSLGAWTLVGCTVSPGFEFEKFVLAPPDWIPGN